ncbi:uncharacterized protein [Antedon mediterranea]|uniref:uncharacterized protein n=1 Tax=Antedon mediterranea TaxID=105859 RepID=UPI003AF76FB8
MYFTKDVTQQIIIEKQTLVELNKAIEVLACGKAQARTDPPRDPQGCQQCRSTPAPHSHACEEFGLKKTNVLSHDAANAPEIKIGDYTLEVVDKFTYLGSTVSSNLSLDAELNIRIGKVTSHLTDKLSRRLHLLVVLLFEIQLARCTPCGCDTALLVGTPISQWLKLLVVTLLAGTRLHHCWWLRCCEGYTLLEVTLLLEVTPLLVVTCCWRLHHYWRLRCCGGYTIIGGYVAVEVTPSLVVTLLWRLYHCWWLRCCGGYAIVGGYVAVQVTPSLVVRCCGGYTIVGGYMLWRLHHCWWLRCCGGYAIVGGYVAVEVTPLLVVTLLWRLITPLLVVTLLWRLRHCWWLRCCGGYTIVGGYVAVEVTPLLVVTLLLEVTSLLVVTLLFQVRRNSRTNLINYYNRLLPIIWNHRRIKEVTPVIVIDLFVSFVCAANNDTAPSIRCGSMYLLVNKAL